MFLQLPHLGTLGHTPMDCCTSQCLWAHTPLLQVLVSLAMVQQSWQNPLLFFRT